MEDELLARTREICMALPEVTERLSHGSPTWFIRGKKTFVTYTEYHHGVDWIALWCAAAPGVQGELVDLEPERFFVPPYVGHRGWIGVRLDVDVDWDEIRGVATDAYRAVAPKKLLAELDGVTIDVDRARKLTPGCENVVHLNNAGAALMPQPVIDALHEQIEREATLGGYEAATAVTGLVDGTYESIARLLGAEPNEIAFMDSATRAWHMGFHSVPLRAGERIVTTSAEYSSSAMSIGQVMRRTGAEVVLLPDDGRGAVELAALDAELDRGGVGLVAVTHVPTSSGAITPVAEIGRRCRAAGVLFLLDACQSVGQLRVDVDEIGCDLLSTTGRKFLRGPRGTGFLYVRSTVVQQLTPPFVDLRAAEWTDAFSYRFHDDARRFECWERSVAGHLGLGAAVDHLLGWGIDAVEERVLALAERLRAGLAEVPGVTVHDKDGPRSGIVTFTLDGVPSRTLGDHLAGAGVNVWVSAGEDSHLDLIPRGLSGGVVRASVHYYNTDAELDRAIGAVASHPHHR